MTERMLIAYILYLVGFAGTIGSVLISNIFENKITAYMFARDLEVHQKIVPFRISLLADILIFVFFALIATGLAIGHQEYSILVIVGLFYLFLGTLMAKPFFTHLDLDDDCIYITVFRKKVKYLRSDIRAVKWQNCRGIIGKALVITFNDGMSYSFNMDHYCGVQNTYNTLAC